MHARIARFLFVALFWSGASAPSASAQSAAASATAAVRFTAAEGLQLEGVAEGFDQPTFATSIPHDARIFVLEQRGRIRIVRDGQVLPVPFLDLSDRIRSGGERGLLGLAFHPDFERNGRFFVNYTDREGTTQVVRFRVSQNPDLADPASAAPVIAIAQPFANHNGGMIAFGPDRMLYIGMGDGGSGGDPFGNAQNLGSLLGKMLRLDVDRATPYAIPTDNPFRGRRDARAEIWAYGLRNPWRFSFDHRSGLILIGDVGQNEYEEINALPIARAGADYGWNHREGVHGYGMPRLGLQRSPRSERSPRVDPVLEYPHEQGCSVTGGYVYRGRAIASLAGTYLFSDYCQGWLRSFRIRGGQAVELREWSLGTMGKVTSFGEDGEGELLVCTHDGHLFRIVAAAH